MSLDHDYSVDIPAGGGGNTISVSVAHHDDGRKSSVRAWLDSFEPCPETATGAS